MPEMIFLNVRHGYIVVDMVEVLALVKPVFLCGEVVNLIKQTFYFNHEL